MFKCNNHSDSRHARQKWHLIETVGFTRIQEELARNAGAKKTVGAGEFLASPNADFGYRSRLVRIDEIWNAAPC